MPDDEAASFQQASNHAVSSAIPVSVLPSSESATRNSRSMITSTASGYSKGTAQRQKLIVFSTPSRYQNIVWILLSTPLIAIVVRIILLRDDGGEDGDNGRNSSANDEISHSVGAWILGWAFLLVVVVYMIVLPKQVDVRSNGSVAIKSFLLTYHIDGVVRAYQAGIGREEFWRPRITFATRLGEGRVVIRRRHGKWDVVVSPEDPEGFIQAVEEVVRRDDVGSDDKDGAMVSPPNGGRKPDLAATSAEAV